MAAALAEIGRPSLADEVLRHEARIGPAYQYSALARLAREMGLEYACLAIVANWAAGRGDMREITLDEVLANVEAASSGLADLVGELARG